MGGLSAIQKHELRSKHIANSKSAGKSSIKAFMPSQQEFDQNIRVKKKARENEIRNALFLIEHDISMNTSGHLCALSTVEKDEEKIKELRTDNNLHKLKAEKFYSLKRAARRNAAKNPKIEAICIDYAKNVSLPNVTTNDVYYKRQLSMFSFNVHVLSTRKSIFYCYHEGVAKKGSNEVASFILHFINTFLDDEVEELIIFSDSCGGQNKNYTLFRLINFVVAHQIHGLKKVSMTFPVRGHSYLECDKNVGLFNLKLPMETPKDFRNMIKTARMNPSPFIVVNVKQEMILNWVEFFGVESRYVNKCPFPIQNIKVIEATCDNPKLLKHRSAYSGNSKSSIIVKPKNNMDQVEFQLPRLEYNRKWAFEYVIFSVRNFFLF